MSYDDRKRGGGGRGRDDKRSRGSDEGGFEFEVEMFVVAVERGYKLGGVPIRTIYGDERSHIRPLRHIVNFMRLIRQTRRRMHSKEQA